MTLLLPYAPRKPAMRRLWSAVRRKTDPGARRRRPPHWVRPIPRRPFPIPVGGEFTVLSPSTRLSSMQAGSGFSSTTISVRVVRAEAQACLRLIRLPLLVVDRIVAALDSQYDRQRQSAGQRCNGSGGGVPAHSAGGGKTRLALGSGTFTFGSDPYRVTTTARGLERRGRSHVDFEIDKRASRSGNARPCHPRSSEDLDSLLARGHGPLLSKCHLLPIGDHYGN